MEEYLQEKQAKGAPLTAKDYFATDILDNTAQTKLVEAIKKELGATKVEGVTVCNNWGKYMKYASISVMIYDYNEDGIMFILGVDGEDDVTDEVDILVGETNEPDITLTLDKCPDGATDASFIYENTALKLMEYLVSRDLV